MEGSHAELCQCQDRSLSVCQATLIFPSCNLPLPLIFNQCAPSVFQRGLCRSPQPLRDASRMDPAALCYSKTWEVQGLSFVHGHPNNVCYHPAKFKNWTDTPCQLVLFKRTIQKAKWMVTMFLALVLYCWFHWQCYWTEYRSLFFCFDHFFFITQNIA